MYLEFFNLKNHPFRLTPDADYLYLSQTHAKAKACMEQACSQRDALAVITGEVGCGKSTLVNRVMSEMSSDVAVARLTQTNLDSEEFLQSVLSQYGFQPFERNRHKLMSLLDNFLFAQNVRERSVVLIIEEAQNLSSAVLDVVSKLADLEEDSEKLISIILVGQPMLRERLSGKDLRSLSSRISSKAHLEPLTQSETILLIRHRLKLAGCQVSPFDDDTYPEIFGFTGGVPRLIVNLCDTAMTAAYVEDSLRVTTEILQTAIAELELERVAEADPDLVVESDVDSDSLPEGTRSVSLLLSERGEHVSGFSVSDTRVLIGRDSDNDVTIVSEYISRHHAQIVMDQDGQYWVKDLNSTNGLYVNGHKAQRLPLNDGDRVTMGYHEIVFHDSKTTVSKNGETAERNEFRETAVFGEVVVDQHDETGPHEVISEK